MKNIKLTIQDESNDEEALIRVTFTPKTDEPMEFRFSNATMEFEGRFLKAYDKDGNMLTPTIKASISAGVNVRFFEGLISRKSPFEYVMFALKEVKDYEEWNDDTEEFRIFPKEGFDLLFGQVGWHMRRNETYYFQLDVDGNKSNKIAIKLWGNGYDSDTYEG